MEEGEHLRGHVARGARLASELAHGERGVLGVDLPQLRQAEVEEHEGAVGAEANVVGLEVAVEQLEAGQRLGTVRVGVRVRVGVGFTAGVRVRLGLG